MKASYKFQKGCGWNRNIRENIYEWVGERGEERERTKGLSTTLSDSESGEMKTALLILQVENLAA